MEESPPTAIARLRGGDCVNHDVVSSGDVAAKQDSAGFVVFRLHLPKGEQAFHSGMPNLNPTEPLAVENAWRCSHWVLNRGISACRHKQGRLTRCIRSGD